MITEIAHFCLFAIELQFERKPSQLLLCEIVKIEYCLDAIFVFINVVGTVCTFFFFFAISQCDTDV